MEKKPEELIRGGDNFALLYREPAQRFENMVRKANSVCVEDAAVPLQKKQHVITHTATNILGVT